MMNKEKKTEDVFFNIIFCASTIILSLIIPWILKLNRTSFYIGFIISILIINFSISFLKNYFFDNSWYSEQYNYNNVKIYKETFKDIFIDIKEGIKYGMEFLISPIKYVYNKIKGNKQIKYL